MSSEVSGKTMDTDNLSNLIEALLFYKGEPIKIHDLMKAVDATGSQTESALQSLKQALGSRGIRLIQEGEYVGLATSPEAKELIEAMRKEELTGPLGKAGLETLAIVIYHGPISRAEIEYVRGVNSSSILRSLSMRGLIEKIDNPKDKRSYLYRGTPELPASLGLTSLSEAPDFEKIKSEIAHLLEEAEKHEEEHD